MSFTFSPFNKQGVLLLRTFPDVAHLPASPTPGQMCCVDDGTVTTLYQALRSGASVAWEIVASPITPFTVVRDDPSDTRFLQLSNDNGVTWPFSVVKAADALTINPQTGAENVIQSVGGATNPLNVIGSDGAPFLATGIGVPGIILRGDDDGTTTAPALRILRATATTSPVSMDFQLEGDAPIPIIQQDGALVVYSAGALPTPGARWLQTIVYVTRTTLADGGAFICIQLADASYAWKTIIFTPPPTPTGQLGFFPALPAIGGEAVSFYMLIQSGGTLAPWAVPPGYEVQVTPISGQWIITDAALPDPSHTGACGADGLSGYTFTFSGETYTLGRLYIAEQANFNSVGYTNLYYECQTTPYVNGQTTAQTPVFLMGASGGDSVGGYIIAQVTVTPAAYDWSLTNLYGTTSAMHGMFGDTIDFDATFLAGGFYNMGIQFNHPVKLTIESISNYTNGTDPTNTMILICDVTPYTSWTTIYYSTSPEAANPVGVVADPCGVFQILSNGTIATGTLKIEAP